MLLEIFLKYMNEKNFFFLSSNVFKSSVYVTAVSKSLLKYL